MRIAVTGSAGLVGRALVRRLSREHSVLALTHPDLDATECSQVLAFARQERPDLLINCAVIGVDECEADPHRAREVNVLAPRWLALAAAEIGAELLHFSSNYVFDGEREATRPYTIEDQPNPINVYGRTKLEGEREVAPHCQRSWIVRTSWVFGPGKPSFLSTVARDLRAGKSVRAISDTWANPTYVADLADRVVRILAGGRHGTYHVVNEGVCTYFEFALEAARLLHLPPARAAELIEPVRESEVGRGAPRPRSTPMRCILSERMGFPPMRSWRKALEAYVGEDGGKSVPAEGRPS